MAENSTGNFTPPDLSLSGQTVVNNLYVDLPFTKLDLNSIYNFQFSYVDLDGNESEPSPVFKVTTAAIPSLVPPKFLATDLTYFNGILNITWNGQDSTGQPYTKAFDRINVYIKDETISGSVYKLVGSLKSAGTVRVPVPPRAHSVKLTVVSVEGIESQFSVSQFETPKLIPNTLPTSVSATWVGTDFKVSFTHNPAEEFFDYYKVTLTANGISKVFSIPAVTGTSSQFFNLSLSQNRATFGVPQTSISGSVKTVNIYGNEGSEVSFSSTSYTNNLPSGTISATAISNGYSVSYTTPTSATFDHIEIEEVESNDSTAPASGYTKVFSGSSNPAITITPNTNKRWIRARFVDNIGTYSSYGTAVSVTPTNPVVADTEGPSNVTSVTTSGGIDTSGYLGFNAYADVSWPAVTGGGIRGYRIRFSNDNGTTYSYVDSPGTGTTYRLGGLAIGATYKIAVATYDEYNNISSSYVSGNDVTVTGTPSVSNYITGGPFQFGVGVGSVATNKGLYFDASNYWYVNATNSARLKVGGSTSNYLLWDGSTFAIDGNITARQGTFSGNVQIASGGSLYSGTYGQLSGNAGYILNTSGLRFDYGTTQGITTIDAATGKLTTASANIGGWDVTSSTINKTSNSGTVTLDSTNAQIRLTSSSYTAGIATPNNNSPSDIVFWAGGSRDTNANFYVRADGTTVMKSATITGYASSADISGLAKTDMSNVTTIDGGKITTGQIKSSNYTAGTVGQLPYSGSGTLFDLSNGSIVSPKFYLGSDGTAKFKGTIEAGTSINSPAITSGSIIGASIQVTSSIFTSGLYFANDYGLDESNDQNASGTSGYTINQTTVSSDLFLRDGVIEAKAPSTGGTGILTLKGESYTQILAGGTQAAMFDSSTSSMQFTTGLYLGDKGKSDQTNVQAIDNTRVPWISIDASLRLRKGAPLRYPNGTPGAYVRNIYIKQTNSAPSATTGNIGDVYLAY